MIALALRLAVSGGRAAVGRLVLIAAAVAIGVGMLLSTLAGTNAVGHQNDRQMWLASGAEGRTQTAAVDPLWWWAHSDYHDGQLLAEVDVAATGRTSPVPPGLARLPAAGEYYASPAFARLLRDTPADQLGDRIPGRLAGVIGADALASPDSLVAVIGRTPAELKIRHDAHTITTIAAVMPPHCGNDCLVTGIRGDALTLMFSVVAAALVFPVLMFIGTATRLSAATREQRYAAMRLVGATPRQTATISTVESTLAAGVGTAVGFGLFLALRPLVATIPFTGARFFTADLTLSAAQVAAVTLGVPAAAALAARVALRRVIISPLGITRRATPRPPRAWRLAVLAAGLGELAFFLDRRPATSNGQAAAYLTGFLLIMVGLVVAGPWLTMTAARASARRARRPATLIAARRLADDPNAGFRSVSGLVLALFVVTATVSIIGTINTDRGTLAGDVRTRTVVQDGEMDGAPLTGTSPDRLVARIRAVPGAGGLAVVHADPGRVGTARPEVRRGPGGSGPGPTTRAAADDPLAAAAPPIPDGLVVCADLARTAVLGHCAAGAAVAAVPLGAFINLTSTPDQEWPAAPIGTAEVTNLPVQMLYVTTDGSTAALERTRTLLTAAYPGHEARTVDDWAADQQKVLAGWRQLASVVLATTLPIAGCSLAVSVVTGLSDRRRPFAMLRLAGAPLPMLRRTIGIESALPLLAAALLAVGAGFAASAMFLRSQLDYRLVPPGATFFVLAAAGLVLSLGIIASTLPLLTRITGPESVRNG
ncbi:FtsX-like permease family protein [Frankia sp. AgB32]|uniref:FtsX-like permease family protein n=1 Tax=Frankia sp. AgB32 TaxID=631119 RepID=UPI00200DEAC6|nr:FtsX-like permease family protein [Frankia sp. AgB32]MCK9897801.1 ABC transporter permease [Frankia sp. AgB32]